MLFLNDLEDKACCIAVFGLLYPGFPGTEPREEVITHERLWYRCDIMTTIAFAVFPIGLTYVKLSSYVERLAEYAPNISQPSEKYSIYISSNRGFYTHQPTVDKALRAFGAGSTRAHFYWCCL